MFQSVSVPPAVQPRSAEVVVTLDAIRLDGGGHAGQLAAPTVRSPCIPLAMIAPAPSVTSHETSPVQLPATQLERAITSPVEAENDSAPIDPVSNVAPVTTVVPLTVTSTELPLHPSP